jgi:curved DNA-binding protein CbpA
VSGDDWINQIPVLNPEVNLTQMQLEPIDGYILSRLDGVSSVGLLADVVAMPAEQLYSRLNRLSAQGAMSWKEVPKPTEVPHGKLQVDLSADERTQIISAEKLTASYTYWELLGVDEVCEPAFLKQRWFAVSRLYHPDRFFGRELGGYQDRLDVIFQRVKDAYATLQDPQRRVEYAKKHNAPAVVQESVLTRSADEMRALSNQPSQVEENEKAHRLEARRQQILTDRKRKKNVQNAEDNQVFGRKLYESGLRELRGGDSEKAAKTFKMAVTYDPSIDEYKTLRDEVSRQAETDRSRRLAARGEDELDMGFAATAARRFAEAADLMPTMGSYAVRASQAFMAAGDVAMAAEYADRAVAASPNRQEFRLAAAAAFQAAGQPEIAREHLLAVASLDAEDDRAKEMLRELDASILRKRS